MERATADHGYGLTLAPICLGFLALSTSTTAAAGTIAGIAAGKLARAASDLWYLLLLLIVSLWLQLGLPAELRALRRSASVLPIIALARHYGWQGALIATLMNALSR